ncbi:MAG: dihydrofolate reductase [Clostridia bacterium]|nr:dihydrofolate reductase [Clostridia bacterium]
MQLIVAVDKFWGIGKNNDLLFSLKEDMKFFRQTTLGKTVVMGYNTLMSFPFSKPLPKRKNIVLTSKMVEPQENLVVVHSLKELSIVLKQENQEDIFIIGGAKFYKTMLPYCKTAYITKVDADGQATTFFEDLDKLSNWQITQESQEILDGEFKIKFLKYENNSVLEF